MMVRTIFSMMLFLSRGTAWTTPSRRLSTRMATSAHQSRSPRKLFELSHPKSHQDGLSMLKMSRPIKDTPIIEKPRRPGRRVRVLAAALGLAALAALVYPKAAAAAVSTAAQATASVSDVASAAPVLQAPVAASVISPPPMVNVGAWGGNTALPRFTELKLSLRLAYAGLLGSVVGWERSTSNHSAGVRTMALVSLGAAAFTVCSMYGFVGSPHNFDPSRMASNVASGVGFIGAGVITTHNVHASPRRTFPQSVVHGLTTAAAIWISAAVGVASGVGMYYIAGTAALSTVSILRFGRNKKQPESFVPSPDVAQSRPSLLESLLEKETMENELASYDEALLKNYNDKERIPAKKEHLGSTKERSVEKQETDPSVKDFQTIVESQGFIPRNSNMTSALWSDENVLQVKHHCRRKHDDEFSESPQLQKELAAVENQTVISR